MVIKSSDYCFACGEKNPIGFKLKIEMTDEGVRTEFVPQQVFEGFKGITHGGIVATLLDEMIAWACRKNGYQAVTGDLYIRFKKPLLIEKKVIASGRITLRKGKLILGESEVRDEEGNLLAFAKAKMYIP